MSAFWKMIIFSLSLIGLFTFYSAYVLPQTKPQAPPKETAVTELAEGERIALGKELFNSKGACSLCHSTVGGRAPLLDDIFTISKARLKDTNYKGKAKTPEEYIHESLVEPSAHVVKGFGVAGTNDAASPMPSVKSSAIGLNDFEIRAIIDYMKNEAGILPEGTEGNRQE